MILKILRIGGINPTSSRFLVLIELSEIEKIYFFIPFNEKNNIEDLIETAHFFNEEYLLKKIEIHFIQPISLLSKIIRKLAKLFKSEQGMGFAYRNFIKEIKNKLDVDFIWIGDNDFDGSNDLFVALNSKIKNKIPYFRSYKETRFQKKWTEYYTLKFVDKLIFPSTSYIDFFKELYNLKLNKNLIADLDWRYSKVISWVKNLNVIKLSKYDNKPHVCILTGKALCSPKEKRSGFRYYFIPIIEELIKRDIVVHLHAMKIIKENNSIENPYEKISRETGLLFIEKPLNLRVGSKDYEILKRYDAGILHPLIPENKISLQKFQLINIPNRLYEYQMANVLPLAQLKSTPEAEKIINKTNFGIIFSDFDDLSEKLFKLIRTNEFEKNIDFDKVKSFKDFSRILLSEYIEKNKN